MMKYVLNTRLDNNKLVDLNGLVSSLDNLRWLNVSTNNLQVMMMLMLILMAECLDKQPQGIKSKKAISWVDPLHHHQLMNYLQWFDFAFIPKSLEWLDVHNNRIKRIGNYYRFASDPNC